MITDAFSYSDRRFMPGGLESLLVIAVLFGLFLNRAAHRVERFVECCHHIHVRTVYDELLARSHQVDANRKRTHGLVTFLADGHFAGAELVVEAAQRFNLFGHRGFDGGRTIDAVENDLQRLGHITPLFLLWLFDGTLFLSVLQVYIQNLCFAQIPLVIT